MIKSMILFLYTWLLLLYTGYHEMPQKACERGFCHVIAFSIFGNAQFFLSDSENGEKWAF